MNTKPEEQVVANEPSEKFLNAITSKFDQDLYDEEKDITLPIIRVKRTDLPNKCERWRIFEDNKIVWTLESNKVSKKERKFLQSVDGFNFILRQAKIGIKSLNAFKKTLREVLNPVIIPPKRKRGRPRKIHNTP
jgi:hypothetical protein